MKVLHELSDGSRIMMMSKEECAALNRSVLVITGLLPIFPVLTAPRSQTQTESAAGGLLSKTPGTGLKKRITKMVAQKPKPSRAKKDRNKTCAACGRKFYDESKTNCRKWCGPHGCSRDDGTGIRSSDLPKAGGRTLPVVSDDAGAGGGGQD